MPQPRFPDAPGRDIPVGTRLLVEERDVGLCRYCGQLGPTLDHLMPWIQGGTHDMMNLVCACQVCNSIAGQRVFDEFSAKRGYVQARRDQLGYLRLSRLYLLAAAGRSIARFV